MATYQTTRRSNSMRVGIRTWGRNVLLLGTVVACNTDVAIRGPFKDFIAEDNIYAAANAIVTARGVGRGRIIGRYPGAGGTERCTRPDRGSTDQQSCRVASLNDDDAELKTLEKTNAELVRGAVRACEAGTQEGQA